MLKVSIKTSPCAFLESITLAFVLFLIGFEFRSILLKIYTNLIRQPCIATVSNPSIIMVLPCDVAFLQRKGHYFTKRTTTLSNFLIRVKISRRGYRFFRRGSEVSDVIIWSFCENKFDNEEMMRVVV